MARAGFLRTRSSDWGLAVLLGVLLGGMVLWILPSVPILYLGLGIAGLAFAYLLLFKIEVAVIVGLLVMYELGRRFNYMGGGTPFHPQGLMQIAIIGGAGYLFLFHRVDSSRLRGIGPFLSFFGLCLVSLVMTGDLFFEGLTAVLRLASALAVYAILLYRLDSIAKVKWVIAAIVVGRVWATLDGLIGIGSRASVAFSTTDPVRIGNSGVGTTDALILVVCLVLFWGAERRSTRILWGSLSCLFVAGTFFSYGRAGWIAFFIALLAVGLLQHRKLLIVIPVLLILALVLVPGIFQRFSDVSLDRLDNPATGGNLAHRVQIWQGALQVYLNQPLTGVGWGVGRYRVGSYLGRYPWMIHNDYLSVLLDLGLIGLILFLYWQGEWVAAVLRVHRNAEHKEDKVLALAVFGALVVSLVSRLTDNLILDPFDLYLLSGLVAAILVLPRIRAQAANEVMPGIAERPCT